MHERDLAIKKTGMALRHTSLPSRAPPEKIGRAGESRGSLTVWDRLFGTYVDPEQVESTGPYGIQEIVHPVRSWDLSHDSPSCATANGGQNSL